MPESEGHSVRPIDELEQDELEALAEHRAAQAAGTAKGIPDSEVRRMLGLPERGGDSAG